jgi:hypothetical protein
MLSAVEFGFQASLRRLAFATLLERSSEIDECETRLIRTGDCRRKRDEDEE